MERIYDKYRGVSPGAVIERELKKKGLKQNAFARAIGVPFQTLNAIIRGTRKMTPETALRIDYGLGFEESTMGVLQAFYDTKQIKQKTLLAPHPDFSRLRKILFWDTDFDRIDWQAQQRAVIERVFERGNNDEKNEIIRFYGQDNVNATLSDLRPARSLPRQATQHHK